LQSSRQLLHIERFERETMGSRDKFHAIFARRFSNLILEKPDEVSGRTETSDLSNFRIRARGLD